VRTTYPSRLASRYNAVAAGDSGYDDDEGLNSDKGPRLSSLTEHAGGEGSGHQRSTFNDREARSSISIPATETHRPSCCSSVSLDKSDGPPRYLPA